MSEFNGKTRVPCNSKVKSYNTQHLNDIAAMNVSEVYNSISASGGIITTKAETCKERIKSLKKKVSEFKPSVPMTREEQQKVDNMLQIWSAQLDSLLSAVSVAVKPTYLRDTVTQILQSKSISEPCSNRHLEWYLVRYNAKQLIPSEIADAIIQHRGSKWDSMPHLVRDTEYNITVADSNKSEGKKTRRKEKDFLRIRDVFEFIESFPATPGIETLDARLANDITVADMVLSWRKKSITRYDDYMTIFQTFINSLQTLPDEARQITFADTTEKATDPKSKGKVNGNKRKEKPKKAAVKPTKQTSPDNAGTSTPTTETSSMPSHAADDNGLVEPQKEEAPSDGGAAFTEEPSAAVNTTDQPEPEGEDVTDADLSILEEFNHGDAPSPEEIFASNKRMMTAFLDKLTLNDYTGQRKVREAAADIEEFCKFENFEKEFEDLKNIVESNSSPYKGGFAAGTIRNKVSDHRRFQQ